MEDMEAERETIVTALILPESRLPGRKLYSWETNPIRGHLQEAKLTLKISIYDVNSIGFE